MIKTWGKNELKKLVQLGFSLKIKVPQLGSARNLPSSAQLESENSSSGSSLIAMYCDGQVFYELDVKMN